MPTLRIGSANAGNVLLRERNIDFKLTDSSEVFSKVDQSLDLLETVVHKAGEVGCDVVALPENTISICQWAAANETDREAVVTEAVGRMCRRLGRAAASHNMYLLCCESTVGADGKTRNIAYFFGRDGEEIGRYVKVHLPVTEQLKEAGETFPVFQTPDLGGVGMLVCYDMVFPEAARCLVLGGADMIFHLTAGGAAFGGLENSLAAFRTRAVENSVYVVVSWGGGTKWAA